MASSNVEYYARQKELQDIIHEQEKKREQLDRQLHLFSKKDERLAKLRATKLQTYWKRVCEDQRRSHQRNQNIIREFSRIDSHLSAVSAKTERLRLLKKQYEDYIERTYPLWKERVTGKGQNGFFQEYVPPQQVHRQDYRGPEMEDVDLGMEGDPVSHRSYYMEGPEKHGREPPVSATKSGSGKKEASDYANFKDIERPMQTQAGHSDRIPSQPEAVGIQSEQQVTRHSSSPQLSRTTPSGSQVPPSPQVKRQTEPSPQMLRSSHISSQQVPPADISAEDMEEMMSQPIQSVTVKGIQGRPLEPRNTESPGGISQSSGGMDPGVDEEESEFGSEDGLPLSGEHHPPPSQPLAPDNISEQSSPDEEVAPPIKASVQPKGGSLAPPPELTVPGLMKLFKYIQSDFRHALSLEGYYRSHPASPAERQSIIQRANGGANLSGLDSELVSMVILEQVTLVIRSLRSPCLLPDSILSGNIDTISQTQIRVMLRDDAQPLWDSLFEHLIQLVTCKVMTPNEVAAVFVPCMVSDKSPYQDKAFELLMKLLKSQLDGKTDLGTPREGLDSLTSKNLSVEIGPDGKVSVPPLKFPGSLIDRSQTYNSDDDTSVITQSVTSSKIPLNATDAYKNMLSGSLPQPQHHMADEDEDTDDDVEKQFASALSPRDQNVAATIPTATTRMMEQDVLSDESSTMATPLYVPTAAKTSSKPDKTGKTTPRSTGLSQTSQRRPGIQFQSDLDTDTEIDILPKKDSDKDKEDEDFFEFYE